MSYNVQVEAEGLQGRSKLEKAMQEWFDGEGKRTRFVLWGPGGRGKSTLALKFAAGQVKREGAACSSVRLVFALSRGSIAQGYAGLFGESCMCAGRGGSAQRLCWHILLTRCTNRQTAGQERRRGVSGARGGAAEGARGAAVAGVERAVAGGAGRPARARGAGGGRAGVAGGEVSLGARADNHHDASRGVGAGRGGLAGDDRGRAAAVRQVQAELGRNAQVRAVQIRARSKHGPSIRRCAWRGRWTGAAYQTWLG